MLGEADYFYDRDNWESTHNDFGTLNDEQDYRWSRPGTIHAVGRLKALPSVYVVAIPCGCSDGEPDDYEVAVFETREAAKAAYEAALQNAPTREVVAEGHASGLPRADQSPSPKVTGDAS